MKKSLMILTVLLVMMVVGISGCITTTTDTQSNQDEVVTNLNTSLNTTGNFVKVDNITEYYAVVNNSRKNPKVDNNTSSDILSKEKVKAAYEDMLRNITGCVFDVVVDGPYLYSNQTPYYVLKTTGQSGANRQYYPFSFYDDDDYCYQIMMEVDAKKLPTFYEGQSLIIHTLYNTYILKLKSGDDITPKISQQQILDKAKEVHKESCDYCDDSTNMDYEITLYKENDTKAVYYVNVLHDGMPAYDEMWFDADSGELLDHSYEVFYNVNWDECRRVALDALDDKEYSFRENLSITNEDFDSELLACDFEIGYTNPDGINETIGHIKVEYINLSVIEFNISEDQVLNSQSINGSDVDNLISEEEAINIVKSDVIKDVKEYPGPDFVSRMTFNSLGLGVSQVGTVYRVDTFIDGNFFMETDVDPITGEIVDSVGISDGSSGIREDGTWGPLIE